MPPTPEPPSILQILHEHSEPRRRESRNSAAKVAILRVSLAVTEERKKGCQIWDPDAGESGFLPSPHPASRIVHPLYKSWEGEAPAEPVCWCAAQRELRPPMFVLVNYSPCCCRSCG